ncbi:MAG TPA: YicC/YloC family endoribonuclease [Ferrovibrio sp.]|jgi:uncharacterized protein (TIGR00255 family)|uniref:YicC/YloC family endoribonuclease n=1 Tax=Ferrovibrio sp. TaxID=1917215 RepID=UPI002ED4B1A7
MSLVSMTGFARADGRAANKAWTWELKSVNGRGLELRFRLPSGFESLEPELRAMAQGKLVRGNITLNLQFAETGDSAPAYRLNEGLLDQLLALAERLEARGIGAPRLDGLLAVRGIIEPVGTSEDEAARDALMAEVKASFAEAVDKLVESRSAEGTKLAGVLSGLLDEIAKLTDQAQDVESVRPEALRNRLRQQLDELLAMSPPVSEERLAQELALQITRLDVREEIDRLRTHVETARHLISGGDSRGVGRKLDFLAQEFNREANTLCSKAFDAALTAVGLDLKLVVDRLREQAQNVE